MKRILSTGLVSIGLLMSATVAVAADAGPAPQFSAKDIEKTFSDTSSSSSAPAAGSCEDQGLVTGSDGECEPARNVRGFSLPTRADFAKSPSSQASAAVPATQTAPAAKHRLASYRAPHRDLLITFKTGSFDLTDQAQANAKVFAEALQSPALAGSHFEVAGYTDAVGSSDKNLTLSQQRADAVKSFLVSQGVDQSRIVSKGYGASAFADPEHPAASANRRVEARRVD